MPSVKLLRQLGNVRYGFRVLHTEGLVMTLFLALTAWVSSDAESAVLFQARRAEAVLFP